MSLQFDDYWEDSQDIIKVSPDFFLDHKKLSGVKVCSDARFEIISDEGDIKSTMYLGINSRGRNEIDVDFGDNHCFQVMECIEAAFGGDLETACSLASEIARIVVPTPLVSKRSDMLSEHVADIEHALCKADEMTNVILVNPSFGTVHRCLQNGCPVEIAMVKSNDFVDKIAYDAIIDACSRHKIEHPKITIFDNWPHLFGSTRRRKKYLGINFDVVGGDTYRWNSECFGLQINPYNESLLMNSTTAVFDRGKYVEIAYQKKEKQRTDFVSGVVPYYRYNWAEFLARFSPFIRHRTNEYCGVYRFCSGWRRTDFSIQITECPSPIGMMKVEGLLADVNGFAVLYTHDGEPVDVVVPEEWGSRHRFAMTFPRMKRGVPVIAFISRSDSGLFLGSPGTYGLVAGRVKSSFSYLKRDSITDVGIWSDDAWGDNVPEKVITRAYVRRTTDMQVIRNCVESAKRKMGLEHHEIRWPVRWSTFSREDLMKERKRWAKLIGKWHQCNLSTLRLPYGYECEVVIDGESGHESHIIDRSTFFSINEDIVEIIKLGGKYIGLHTNIGQYGRCCDKLRLKLDAVMTPYCSPISLLTAFRVFSGSLSRCYLHADLAISSAEVATFTAVDSEEV